MSRNQKTRLSLTFGYVEGRTLDAGRRMRPFDYLEQLPHIGGNGTVQ